MCDRSRWKPRAYCYTTKKINSVATTRWEYQIPKEEDYWNQFCQQEESKMIVRNSCPNSLYSSIVYEHPFNPNHVVRNKNSAKKIDNFIKQHIHEKEPLAKYKFNIPPVTFKPFSKENDINSVDELALPMITVSPTLSETANKIFHVHNKEFEEIFTEKTSSGRDYSSQFCMNDRNALSENIRNRKIYSRRNCPFHRNEPPMRIFDDDIERYLVESNRKNKANVESEIISKDGQLLVKKTCKICRQNMNECTSKSMVDLMDDIKLPEDLNSNKKSSSRFSNVPPKNGSKSECSLKSIENYSDDIRLLNHLNSNQHSLSMQEILKLNDSDLEPRKFVANNVDDVQLSLNSEMMIQDTNVSSVPKLSERKCKSTSKIKSEKLITKLPENIKKRRGSSINGNVHRYSFKYAYQALKYLRPNKKINFDPTTHETRKTISPKSGNRKKESANDSMSLKSLISFDRELGDRLKDHSSSTANFLNRLPKLSYFPRKNHDRCLSCLYRSVDKMIESKIENTCKITRSLTPMKNVSIDSDSSDITLQEFKDNEYQVDDYVNITDYDVATDKHVTDLSDTQKVKKETPEVKKPLTDEVKETEECPTELKLGLESPIDKKIDLKSTFQLSEKSKISSSYSSSDDDKSSSVYLDDNSKTSKYRAPCHAPTILSHTLESLRTLKMRKSTPLQTRIALDESIVQDSKNVQSAILDTKQQDKLASKDCKTETMPTKKLLTKVKSVSENLIAKSEDISKDKKERVLRRGSSCVNLEKILQDFARGTKLDSVVEDDSERSSELHFLFSNEEIEKVLNDFEQKNLSTINMLSALCDMFLTRVVESHNIDKNQSKIMKRLIKLLIDSRRYLYPNKFPDELIFSSSKFVPTQRPLLNPERLRNILPLDSYNLIAPLLGMPEYYPRMPFAFHGTQSPIAPEWKHRSDKSDSSQETGDDLIVHPPSGMVDTIMHDELESSQFNPYALFLKKERRKVVTWRPLAGEDLKGYDPEATIRMRADKVTIKICKDFCKWLRSLGGAERGIDETVLKDMFEISFSADACKATQIDVKEMTTVPTDVASARLCHDSSVLAMTRKQLHRDANAEDKPKRVVAFGTSMPTDLLFVPPINHVRQKWLECKNVPRDLETMETVWGGIKDLDSVQGFLKWSRRYPEIGLPEALTKTTHRKLKSIKKKKNDLVDPKKRNI